MAVEKKERPPDPEPAAPETGGHGEWWASIDIPQVVVMHRTLSSDAKIMFALLFCGGPFDDEPIWRGDAPDPPFVLLSVFDSHEQCQAIIEELVASGLCEKDDDGRFGILDTEDITAWAKRERAEGRVTPGF